jgi:hypothetical protein
MIWSSNSQRSASPFKRGWVPLSLSSAPQKNEGSRAPTGAGAERRTRWSVSRADPSPRTLRDDRPMTRAGAPFGALLRRSPYGVGPRFLRRHAPPSAGSRQGIVVPPGGAPTPPGCVLCVSTPAGAAPARGPELPGAGCRILGPVLRSRLRPAPRSRRLMSAPLWRAGCARYDISPILGQGIFTSVGRSKRSALRHRLSAQCAPLRVASCAPQLE